MCKDLRKTYKDSAEYLVAFFYQSAIRRMQNEIGEKERNTKKSLSFLF